VREEGDDGEVSRSETPSLLSYTLTYVSFTEVVRVFCQVPLREPIHLCTCVSEERGDEEAARSETPSLLWGFDSGLTNKSTLERESASRPSTLLLGVSREECPLVCTFGHLRGWS
jgi:hypothetical protein